MLKSFLKSCSILALIAAVVWLGQQKLEHHQQSSALEDDLRVLHGRVRRLHTEYGDLDRIAEELRADVVAASNRVAEAHTALAEERATHDPLRRQIERMSRAEIQLQGTMKKQQQRIAELSKRLQATTDANSEAVAQSKQQLATAQATLNKQTGELTAARAEIEKLKSEIASIRQQRTESEATINRLKDETAKKIGGLNTTVAAEQKTSAQLKAQLDQKSKELARKAAQLTAAQAEIAALKKKAAAPAAP